MGQRRLGQTAIWNTPTKGSKSPSEHNLLIRNEPRKDVKPQAFFAENDLLQPADVDLNPYHSLRYNNHS
jgi:hypothetical protein